MNREEARYFIADIRYAMAELGPSDDEWSEKELEKSVILMNVHRELN